MYLDGKNIETEEAGEGAARIASDSSRACYFLIAINIIGVDMGIEEKIFETQLENGVFDDATVDFAEGVARSIGSG